ncbi:hypothetical protein BC829DRAFT_73224 [Chytridium lagenaria]|nr:hypothetical protein BC829DRAFT_73224 [Chytridium lagenaria]
MLMILMIRCEWISTPLRKDFSRMLSPGNDTNDEVSDGEQWNDHGAPGCDKPLLIITASKISRHQPS